MFKSTELIVAGQPVHDFNSPKFVNWVGSGWDATIQGCVQSSHPCSGQGAYSDTAKNKSPNRYSTRRALRPLHRGGKMPPLDAAKGVIRKFVLHHDGCDSSKTCWNVLHNERGLSCHFLIDNNGTIYQTLDLVYMGYHAAQYNVDSIGVEFCNRGDAKKEPTYYSRRGVNRPTAPCKINGHTYLAFDYTDEQYRAMLELAAVLIKVFPNLPVDFPRDPKAPGDALWETMGPLDAKGDSLSAYQFAGYIGHYHLTRRKWDPGPFDFKKFCDKLRGQRVFPLWVGKLPDDGSKPTVPDNVNDLKARTKEYYDANEQRADGGFFPVGPWGETRIWHGGVHLPAEPESPIYAPFPGRVVAGRMGGGPPSIIGSNNFVLLRHDLNVADRPLRFFMLYMHLASDDGGGESSPTWLTSETKKSLDLDTGVNGYDEPVEAGQLIGRVGSVGPIGVNRAQIHLEAFATRSLFKDDPDWTGVDGYADGRLCSVPAILELIDTDKDGRASSEELLDFYRTQLDTETVNRMAVYHISEWTDTPDWTEALTAAECDFTKKCGKRERDVDRDDRDIDIKELVEEQLAPFTWWTDKVARALGLPSDGAVYHYHPIRLLEKINAKLIEAGASDAVDASQAKEVNTAEVKGDIDDETGESAFVEEKSETADDLYLELENLVQGWEGDPDHL